MRVEVIGLNEAGELVGKADVPGSLTYHAFLAKNGLMTDLGTQDGDPCSDAISINEQHQIVGFSEDCSGDFSGHIGHAFLWENGHMTDLNAFVPLASSLKLTVANFINDRGEIAVEGVLPNGDLRAALLIPCDRDDADTQGCQDSSETITAKRNDLASVTPASTSLTPGRLISEMSAALGARSRGRNRGFGTWRRE
jgi:probable HAF family extracellular repeat protein